MPSKTVEIRRTERYDCSECPGYCCSYRLIPVTPGDLTRLAKHFGTTEQTVKTRHTRVVDGELAMRTRRDRVYSSICAMFNQEKRCCSIYEARPDICRKHPGGRRCGYYDTLKAERAARGDESYVPEG